MRKQPEKLSGPVKNKSDKIQLKFKYKTLKGFVYTTMDFFFFINLLSLFNYTVNFEDKEF